MKPKTFNSLFRSFSLGLALTSLISACGSQKYVSGAVSSDQTAPGDLNLPPKIDILFGVSMNGSMKDIYPNLLSEIPAFISGLQNSGWDYHFISLPLSEYTPAANQSISQTTSVSRYDTAYYALGNWLSPYPGAAYNNPVLGIAASFFSPSFVIPTAINPNYNDAHETGVQNQWDFLTRNDIGSNPAAGQASKFLRSDALLAIVTLSNGEDRSSGSWKWNWNYTDKIWSQDNPNYFNSFASAMITLKGSAQMVRYYSLVANNTTCRGSNSWVGNYYNQVAALLGGAGIDICTNALSAALNSIKSSLQTVKLSYQKRYLVIGNQPNPTSIQVTKYAKVGNNYIQSTLPNNAVNGWTYAGYLSNAFTIDAPVPMAQASGYMIELHGTAKLVGDDRATVQYLNGP